MLQNLNSKIFLIFIAFILGCNQSEERKQKPEEFKDTILADVKAPDTIYYDNGKPHTISYAGTSDVSKTYEYYHNGQLSRISEQGTFQGCSIQVGDEINYDSLGNLVSKSSFKHNLPKDAIGCHDTHTIISTAIL